MTAGIEIDVRNGVEGLEREWWDLWARDPAATPFQSPAWLIPWRRQFGEGESVVATVRRAGRLAGLLPLFTLEGRLLPWGAGTSDYLGGVFEPSLDPTAAGDALARLVSWGPLDLFQLPAGSPLARAPAPAGWEEHAGPGEPNPALPLPAALPKNMRENLRYYRNRAMRSGIVRFELATAAALDVLLDLHRRRWTSKGGSGALSDPRVVSWHREALPALERSGLLRLWVLFLDGRPIATLYGLSAKGAWYHYIAGFDPEYDTLGPGTLLFGHALQEAEAEGCRLIDFLRGREAYKYRRGAADRPTYRRLLIPPGTP